jgi:predicted transcriptional regulator
MTPSPKSKPQNSRRGSDPNNLPDAELDVLGYLWQHGEATARDILDGLAKRRPMAHPTVLTLLERLRTKKFVTRRKSGEGKTFVFRASRKPGPTHRRLIGDLRERLFGGDNIAMVASLFETRTPNADEIDQLEQLVNELKEREQKRRR